ncbi:unnamed protein product [Mytilus coruscus]|uniref:RNase H type-1 domain-containing protein n=1 Tax=Mytilus coruscus TaxID=42192 RepID=A0A6J8A6M8_MYTCO|nr:unnamed protein product [Mytilus coruscus]
MSNSDPDLNVRDPTESSGANTELSTDGAVSLFSTVLSNALKQQKNNIIQHFENRFATDKSEKATGVDATDFLCKHEGNRIQHSFNIERSDKLSKIDSYIKFNSLDAASRLISEEKETLRKRNKILKIADKHGWDTVQEYLDSPLADNKDDAVNLRSAIARANSRRRNSKPYDPPVEKSTNANSTPITGTMGNQAAISNQQCVFTATSPVTSQESAHSKQSHLQLSAHQKNRFQNQHEMNSSQSSVINEVEYSFDIINNYETETGKTLINVKGNLRKNVEFWKNVLCTNDFIINTINLGYRIPFVSEPSWAFLRNNMSAIKYSDFVEKSISELLDTHCIKEVTCPPFVVKPLTVSVQSSDNGFGLAVDFDTCTKMANQVRDDLKKSGFVANEMKSVWTPQHSIEWLGFIWNLSNSSLEIPNKKFQGLKLCISALLEDASEYAGAGFTVGDNHILHFMWDKEDRIKSSTWRELKAVKNILESLQLMLCGKLVKLYTDYQNVVKIVQKGSMKLALQVISLDIFQICLNNNIVLEVEWIPRNENTCADALSKIFDFDDLAVSQNIFKFFNSLWGPFTCDTFADDRNKRLPVFFSKFFTPGTSGVDAFAYDWSKFNNWSQWKQFEGYANNPRLASVIDVLPSIIESSKAKSTNNKYHIYFEKFRKWCVSFCLQYSPATSTTISLYIGGLIQQGISVSVLESNYYSIKWHHYKNFKDNPCSDEFLSLILEGGKRILSRDGTRGYVTGEFNDKGLIEDISGFTLSQIHSVNHWLQFYMKDYTLKETDMVEAETTSHLHQRTDIADAETTSHLHSGTGMVDAETTSHLHQGTDMVNAETTSHLHQGTDMADAETTLHLHPGTDMVDAETTSHLHQGTDMADAETTSQLHQGTDMVDAETTSHLHQETDMADAETISYLH